MSGITISGSEIYLEQKHIATVINNRIMCLRQKSIHFYRNLNSWCINYELFQLGLDRKVSYIQIVDKKNKESYKLSYEKAIDFNSKVNNFVTNENVVAGERQLAFPESLWDKLSIDKMGNPLLQNKGIEVGEFLTDNNLDFEWLKRITPSK